MSQPTMNRIGMWLLTALAALLYSAQGTSIIQYITVQCDSTSVSSTLTAIARSLIGCGAQCTASTCGAFTYSSSSCTLLGGNSLICQEGGSMANGVEVYVQSSLLEPAQDCPLAYPYATGGGSTCCANYVKVNNSTINSACDGTVITFNDPSACCKNPAQCATTSCTSNPRFTSGCFLTGYDSNSGYTLIPGIANASVCHQKCQQTAGCNLFTYLSTNWSLPSNQKNCYVKNGVGLFYNTPTLIGGPASCTGIGCMMTNTTYATSTSVSSSFTTYDEYYCQKNCQLTNNCLYFTYAKSNSTCYLMSNAAGIIDAIGFISGPKICV